MRYVVSGLDPAGRVVECEVTAEDADGAKAQAATKGLRFVVAYPAHERGSRADCDDLERLHSSPRSG